MDLHPWLEERGLGKYHQLFFEHEIYDTDILSLLTEAELEAIGIPIGSRKIIARELASPVEPHPTPREEPVGATLPDQPASEIYYAPEPESHDPQPPAETTQPLPHSSVPSRYEPKGKSSRKATAILIAVIVHVVLILIATTLTIFAASRDEPEITAMMAPPSSSPEQEMKKKTVQKQVKRAPSAASAAAAPMAQMMKANAVARFSTPDVTRTSTGPLGMGEGDLGSGAFGMGDGLGDAGVGGGTLFGSTGAGSLKGFLYDIKRDGNGKPRKIAGMESVPQSYKDFMPHLHDLIKNEFDDGSLSKHTRVGRQLTFSSLVIPKQDAKIGPEAFGAKGEMKPAGWLAIYRGRIKAGPDADIRLVGRFDDVLLVFHNGKLVLDGTYVIGKAPTATKFRPSDVIRKHPFFRQDGNIGPWFNLKAGDELIVVVGEIPGGHLGGGLFCQEKGMKYKKGQFAPFVIGNLSEDDEKRLAAVPGCTLEKVPEIF